MKYKLNTLSKNKYSVIDTPKKIIIYLTENLLYNNLEEESIRQLVQASKLKNVIEPVIGMPDIHTGFGLPIGGVLATDYNTGVISAGAVGYDINCGVRLLSTNIFHDNMNKEILKNLSHEIAKKIPLGVGKDARVKKLKNVEIDCLAFKGMQHYIEKGYGRNEDSMRVESNGCLKADNIPVLTKKAKERLNQLGTLGSGNHFIEIGVVDTVFDKKTSNTFGIKQNTLYVLIHSGSRGFGSQIATDYSKLMWENKSQNNSPADTKGLANASINSKDGQDYLNAMSIAANYAFSNRQIMTHFVREAFSDVMKKSDTDLGLDIIYDVAHNIAKKEKHNGKYLLVHRKGATRALPPGHKDNQKLYYETGQPAIIPGSMGTYSFVVTGTEKISETFNTVNHGSGRLMSRKKAKNTFNEKDLLTQTEGIILTHDCSLKNIIDEAPGAYKDINEVVYTLINIGLTKPIVRLKPLAVLKGD